VVSTGNEIIAAILTAGMLPSLPAPAEPSTVSTEERKAILGAVQHALGLYSTIQEALRNAVVPDYTGERTRTRPSRRDQ